MTSSVGLNDIKQILEIFKALSYKTRLDIIVELIFKHECNVNSISKILNIPQSTISQHLTVLKNAGIIEGFRKGTQIYYKVINKQTSDVIKLMITKSH